MAGVFETLYLLLDADTTGLKKGEQEAKKTSDGIATMFKGVAGALTAAFAAAGIGSRIMQQADLNDQLGDTAALMGVNAKELEVWGAAAVMADGSVEGFQGSIKTLAREIEMVATKGKSKAKPFFDDLGISLVDGKGKARDVFEVYKDLAGAFEGISKQEALGKGLKMGLDEGTIMMLQRGRRGIEELQSRVRAIGEVSEKATEAAGEYDEQLKITNRIWDMIASKATEYVLPALTAVMRGFEKFYLFLKDHKDLVQGVGIAMAAVGAVIFAAYVPAMWAAATATLAAAAPFLAVAAAVGAIGLAFSLAWEDIQIWQKGGDSLIGSWLGSWDNFSMRIGDYVDSIIAHIQRLMDLYQQAVDLVSGGFDIAGGAMDTASQAVSGWIQRGKESIGLADSSPLNSVTSGAISNTSKTVSKSNSVQIGKVELQQAPGTDTESISKGIAGGLQQHMAAAIDQSDDGMLA